MNSVKVIYLDRKKVIESVKRGMARVARAHPEINRVILFGSLARGDAVPGSDADLIVLLESSDKPFLGRMPLYVPTGVPVGVDVFPYTEDEAASMIRDGNPFVTRALSEGMVIFARERAGAGQGEDHENRV